MWFLGCKNALKMFAALDPVGGAYSTPPGFLAGLKGVYF